MLDEPTAALSPKYQQQIIACIDGLRDKGVTILLVEQNANMALHLANRGYVLETGNIVLEDDAKALLDNPQVKEAYLG